MSADLIKEYLCDGWTFYNHTNKCIAKSEEYFKLDWSSAEQRCQNEGGHLLSIHDDESNEFFKDLVVSDGALTDFWIGGFREDKQWKWSGWYPEIYLKTENLFL